jgi:Outer membrane protein beta-barrel domain
MKKLSLLVIALIVVAGAFAQNNPEKKKRVYDMSNRANDHFMFQLGVANWSGKPDSIRTKGFGRTLNVYLMLDFPFKTDPRFSVGLGVGVGTDGIYFDRMNIDIAATSNTLKFSNGADTNRFKKYKLATAYLEAPIELRFTLNPERSDKSFKAALGVKVGTMLNAHTKGKNLQDRSGNTIKSFTQKETSRKFFNSSRLSVTGRIGWGNYTIFGSYQINPFIREGFGPAVRPFTIGLAFGGL